MISAHSKRFVAWLGIVAMLLLVCAPTVSRCLAAAQSLTLSICTEAAQPGQAPVAINVSVDGHHDEQGKHSGSHALDDCGYCTLMMHEAALPSVPPALPSMLLLVLLALALPPMRRYTPIGAFPSGRPRAPPRFS
ncbi:DUF2946 domain-containing protein [Candidimonas humi]|uniref:DUF2946 domain-containing protein n=1 Tax=Candidimonas humi TaxID=683355 RepID=A0ABV8P581_9BURK|nr:DUF2946 domain-containing protein [Candidimonas humi]MBV6303912.1 DUF2946 domain-containing protein [Candidimonas humi]